MPKISVVINTLNEERHIENAIRSVCWADEVVVVDQLSDDRTIEIAESLKAKVFTHPRSTCVEEVRAFAVGKAAYDWILILDADELVPKSLSEVLIGKCQTEQHIAFKIPRENYICGRLMSGSGWAADDDYQLRFFRKGALEFNGKIHEGITVSSGATVESLPYQKGHALIHFNYRDMTDFIARLNRYTTAEVLRREGQVPPSRSKSLRRAFRSFTKRFWRQKGYRDGWQGFYLSLSMSFYSLAVDAKVVEKASGQDVSATYAAITKETLAAYEVK